MLGVCISVLRGEKGDKRDCPFNRQSRLGVLYGERFYSKKGKRLTEPVYVYILKPEKCSFSKLKIIGILYLAFYKQISALCRGIPCIFS